MVLSQHLKARTASKIALGTNLASQSKSVADHVKKSRAAIEFQILSLQSELKLLDELCALEKDEKVKALFATLDKDTTGSIRASELVDGLGRVRGDASFSTQLTLAMEKALSPHNGNIDSTAFAKFLDQFATSMDCSLNNIVEMIVTNILFPDKYIVANNDKNGNTILERELVIDESSPALVVLEEKKESLSHEDAKEIRLAMKDERMQALFRVFDQHDHGVVDFNDIVVGFYKAFPSLDDASHAAVSALLLFDENQKRGLTYQEFARLMLNVTASAPDHITFDDVADSLTRNAVSIASGVTSEYVLAKYSMDKSSKLLLDLKEDVTYLGLGVVELAKLDRLFDKFDSDRDGNISAKDLVLGLSKLHDTMRMKAVVKESEHVMSTFDKSSTGNLNKPEFASFIVNFAKSVSLELVDLLDFMLVVAALKDNAEAEKEYMNIIKAQMNKYKYWYG